jgi:DNA-directed RNA polymerase specialized sigma24 family protein
LKTPVEIAYQKHDKWIEIVETFGGLKQTEVEDLVQTMYMLLIQNTQKGVNFMYNDTEVNYWYVYRILRGLYVDLIRKKAKVKLTELKDIEISEQDHTNYQKVYEKIQSVLKDMYWYDRKVYEIIEEGTNISELSRKSNISYYSLYNTYNKVKEKLKQYI